MSNTPKCLFVSCTLPPEESATGHVLDAISKELIKAGCDIDGLTVKRSFCESDEIQYASMRIHKADIVIYPPAKKQCLRDILMAVWLRLDRRKPKTTIYREWVVRALVKKMESLPMEEYDWVIAVSAYYDATEALFRYCKKHTPSVNTALYQVDPLSGNEAFCQENTQAVEAYERQLHKMFDRVFTTPIIYREKMLAGWDASAITALEFPVSVRPREMKVTAHDEIRCVYAGYLYGKIRSADATLALFSALTDPRIHIYFVGSGQAELLKSYAKGPLKGRLHLLGQKSAQECDEILADADVLINIGNTVSNQVPSKLLHYIGFGKPILNITACENCPSLPYIERYPLAISIQETKVADQAVVSEVQNWLQENSGSSIAPEEIQLLFEDCTPEHIAKTMMKNL